MIVLIIRNWFARQIFVAVALILALLLRVGLTEQSITLSTYITFYPIVFLAALLGGMWTGILATTLSALMADYFLLDPVGQFTVHSASDIVDLAIFCISGVTASIVSGLFRRNIERRTACKIEAAVLNEWEKVEEAGEPAETVATVRMRIQGLFESLRGKEGSSFSSETVPIDPEFNATGHESGLPTLDDARLRALLRWTVAVPFLVTLTLAGAALWAAYDFNDTMQWVDHTDQVIGQSLQLLVLQVDMETGERGYLVTGNDKFLQPYQEASKVVDSLFQTLYSQVSDNPSQRARLEKLHSSLVHWRGHAERMIAMRRAGGAYSDLGINFAGKAEMDEIRGQISAFQSAEEHLRDERARTAHRDWHIVLAACVFLGLGLGAGLAVFTLVRMRVIAASFEQSSRALAESERRWVTTLASIGDAVMAADKDGRVTFLNPVAAALTGWQLEDALGQPIRNVFHILNEQTRASAEDMVNRVLKGGVILESSNHRSLLTKDGRSIPIENSVTPILDGSGAIAGAVLVFRDITERRRAEIALRENRFQLGVALRAAQAGDFVWNTTTNEIAWSEEGMAVFGVRPEEFGGRYEDWYDRLIPEDSEAMVDAVQRSVQSGELDTEFRIRRKDTGEVRWIAARGVVTQEESGVTQRMVGINMDITERKQAEEARARLAAIIESSGDPIISKDLAGIVLSWNRSAERVFGYSAEEIVGQPITLIIPPGRRIEEAELMQRLRQGHHVEHFETLRLRKGGEQVDVSVTISPVCDAAGTVIGISTIARDITERKQMEETLRRQASFIDLTPDAFMVRDLVGTLAYWNRGAETLYGWRKDEAVGQQSHHLFRTKFPQDLERINVQLGRTGSWSGELVHHAKDGRTIVVQSKWLAQFDAHGKMAEILESNVDITARKQAEQQLLELNRELEDRVRQRTAQLEAALADRLESEQRFVTLANFVPQIVWMCTPDGLNIYFNQRWVEYTGLTLEESYGEGWTAPFHPDDRQSASDAWIQAIQTGENYRIESRLRAADGRYRWFLMLGVALREDDGRIVRWFGTCTDIANLKQAEEALRESQHGLMEANKELQSFSYSVSHDLRGPLRTMDGFSQALLEDHSQHLDEKGKHYVLRIRKAAQRMGSLIDDLLQLSRLTRVEMRVRPVDLSALSLALIDELRDSEPGRSVEVRVEPGLQTRGDQGLLQVALQNLLSNAWKFTARRDHAVIEVGEVKDGPDPAFFVRDNGAGFDMQYADHLFSPFQRLHADEEFKGTGIGLATVQRIMRRHSGRVWADAAVEQGATFYFQIGV